MQMMTKIFRKAELSPSFSFEDTVTDGTKLGPIKALAFA